MKMMLRQAHKKDLPAIGAILKPWTDADPSIREYIESLPAAGDQSDVQCRILESDKVIRCAALWVQEKSDEAKLLALGFGPGASEVGADTRFLKETVSEWSDLGLSRVTSAIPGNIAADYVELLKSCGFMFEGITSCFDSKRPPEVRLSKHFLYKTVPGSQAISFLKELLTCLGYEIRPEDSAFGYRVKAEYRFPFIFSSWHRIALSGSDIVVHPPARILELHELETLFHPLRLQVRNEKAIVLFMEKKRAASLIDMPEQPAEQDSLFDTGPLKPKMIHLNDLTYTYPTGIQHIRKGIPILFFVNRVGAVGVARVQEWFLDEPRNLYKEIEAMGWFDPEDVKEHTAKSGAKAGKVLAIKFQWYKAFRRIVTLDEIKQLESNFNPQRTRSISWELLNKIQLAGTPKKVSNHSKGLTK
jgi:N-acetylglutamate synthase-like GNAT family acetyltransferase